MTPPARAWIAFFSLFPLVSCYDIGEPEASEALVTWAAFPDTVPVNRTFSLEFAGPITPNACGRLDTATVEVRGDTIRLSGRRSVFDTMCSKSRVSFYEARALRVERAGTYAVVTRDGRPLGSLVALDSVEFTLVRTRGTGTLGEAGGCALFGPGWLGNQRPFALVGLPADLRAQSGSERVLYVSGELRGFSLCGQYGSRPRIRVDTAYMTDLTIADYYPDEGSAP